MSDLTLKEALEQYEAECREVLTFDQFHLARMYEESDTSDVIRQTSTCTLIGACVVWLAGKLPLLDNYTNPEWPDPLRFYLEEVRQHMGGGE